METHVMRMNTKIALYKVPRNSRIKIGNTELNFHKVDGMYSYCTDDNGKAVHISAIEEVEILESHQPKGGMCTSCKKSHDDCSGLDFKSMPILSRDEHEIIVRCTDFQRKPN